MNRKSLTPLALALVIYNLNIPTAVGYDAFTESNKAYSFILGFGQEIPKKCVKVTEYKNLRLELCKTWDNIDGLKKELFIFDKNRIHPANELMDPKKIVRNCLTQNPTAKSVKMAPCVDEDLNQKISILPFSFAYDYFKIVFEGGLCLSLNSYQNIFELDECDSTTQFNQKFTPKIITEMIQVNIFNNNRKNKNASIITKNLKGEIVQQTYVSPISPGKSTSTSVLDFMSYSLRKTTTQVTANSGTQYFEPKNVRSGDTVEVTILPGGAGVSIGKRSIYFPELIRDDLGSMLISTDQPEMEFYAEVPSAISLPLNRRWLLRVYEDRFFKGKSYLKHDTNYLIEHQQKAGSIRVLQTDDPKRTIRFKSKTESVIEMDYIAFKRPKSNVMR